MIASTTEEKSVVIEAEPGESIYRVVERAIARANETQRELELVHNSITVKVYPGSHEYDIVEKWMLKRELWNLR